MQSTDHSQTSHNEGPGGVETSGVDVKNFTPTDDSKWVVDGPPSIFSNSKLLVDLQIVSRMIPESLSLVSWPPRPSLSEVL